MAAAVDELWIGLTQMNAKLDNAICDIVGVTGQRIVRAIAAGERDAPKLAKLRHAGMRASEGEIVISLQGNRREEHLFADRRRNGVNKRLQIQRADFCFMREPTKHKLSLKVAAKHSKAQAPTVKTRRRGTALEGALLGAAWAELVRGGYSAFTIESVALRAQTSRPVIARRWSSRGDLAMAAFKHHIESKPLTIPDESDIRSELIQYIVALYERDFPIALIMWTQMDEYYREEHSSPAHFRETLLAGRASAVRLLLERAAKRGEVDASKLTEMVVSIPGAFLAFTTATRGNVAIRAAVEEMIDSILLPLVATKSYLRSLKS